MGAIPPPPLFLHPWSYANQNGVLSFKILLKFTVRARLYKWAWSKRHVVMKIKSPNNLLGPNYNNNDNSNFSDKLLNRSLPSYTFFSKMKILWLMAITQLIAITAATEEEPQFYTYAETSEG